MAEPKRTVPVVVRMDADLYTAVKARAATEERTMAQAIRYALRCWMESAED